jgi:glycosyltransferase involved in cell wall biosynthesis
VRSAEFVRLLPARGWEPIVISVQERYYEHLDTGRYIDLRRRVVRTRKLPGIDDLVMGAWSRFRRGDVKARPSRAPIHRAGPLRECGRERTRAKFLRLYNSLLVYLPDKERGWVLPALVRGCLVVRRAGVEAVVSTGPPNSAHLVGLGLKLLTGRKWIADFRDPWEPAMKPDRSRSWMSLRIEAAMESAVIRHCDGAVSVTERMTRRLSQKYPECAAKLLTITNGFNGEITSFYTGERKREVFTISYLGSLYFGRDPSTFFAALQGLCEEGRIPEGQIEVRLVGDCKDSDGKSVAEMVELYGLQGVVNLVNRVPQAEAFREVARAHAVLLMAPHQPLQIPGKVFEYIALNARIIAVCGDGATKDLLRRYPLAVIVEPDDVRGLMSAIEQCYRNELPVPGVADRFPREEFERGALTDRMADLLTRICS